MRLSPHFDSSEFACHCGCDWGNRGADVSPRLIRCLELMRHELGDVPLEINSGCRCPQHNANVGGVENSRHVMCDAADVAVPYGMDSVTVAAVAEECGADGIGTYENFVHIDMRGYPSRW